jgi:DNA-directed RNA polymerase alpha subunit
VIVCPHCNAELELRAFILEVKSVPPARDEAWRRIPLNEMALSTRAHNCFHNEGLNCAGEIAAQRDQDLLRIPNFGPKSLTEVREVIAALREPHK